MNSVSRNDAIEIVRRTRKNLLYIRRAFECQEDVHVVTQLVTSLLGLVVLPKEQYWEENIWNIRLDKLTDQGWPKWDIQKGCADNLGQLIKHLRNASSHGRITFSSDSPLLSEVVLKVEDAKGKDKPPYWRALIGGEDLYSFCLRFADHLEETIG